MSQKNIKFQSLKLLSLIMVLLITLSACAANAESGQEQEAVNSNSQVSEPETRIITDTVGREITIPSQVHTVATLGSTARLLTYSDCVEHITGLSDLEKEANPGMPYAYVNRDYFQSLTSVSSGGASSETYEEALLMLQPDLIFTSNTDVEAMNTLQDKLHIPVVILNYEGIFDDSVYQSIELIGEIMGTQDHCQALISDMKLWQEDLNTRTKDIPDSDKPSVYCGAVSYRGAHGIDGTYGDFPPLKAINAKNVVDTLGTPGPLMIDKEQLLVWDPDVIFLTPGNMSLVNEDYQDNPDFYHQLSAVQKGQVYAQINYNYYGTNTELSIVDAYYAGKILYPQAFGDIDFNQKADEIFETMLGSPYLEILNANNNKFESLSIGD